MTEEDLLVGDTKPVESPPAGSRRRWPWVLGTAVGLLIALLIGAALVPVPYILVSPGSVYPTGEHIEVVGAPTYDDGDDLSFTTVSIGTSSALRAFVGWLDPSVDVRPEHEVLGDRTVEENRELNLRQMATSQQIAVAVALMELGYEVVPVGTGAVVVGVEDDGAAVGLLERGDVIVEVDGTPVSTHLELIEIVQSLEPGDEMSLVVEPLDPAAPGTGASDGTPEGRREINVVLGENPQDPSSARMGVSLSTRELSYDLPFEVTIDSGSVGGPSAGLALTLGVIDVLTPGNITGGLKVATTGTIGIDGRVGPVGAVEQKAVTVRRNGTDLFLVPSSEVEVARRHAGDVRVEPVDSLDDALAVLASVGGHVP